jgi:hypothetical protein
MSPHATLSLDHFLDGGFDLRPQLAAHLALELEELERRLPLATESLAAAHPGAFDPQQAEAFYESGVGTGHLLELAAWHLSSADYIADTLRLQQQFARGQVLDFGGGIGTHALAAAALPQVEAVWFVDLNPENCSRSSAASVIWRRRSCRRGSTRSFVWMCWSISVIPAPSSSSSRNA